MCHGSDAKASGPLAHKSNPSTPDLTTAAFKKRLADYPGVIVSSIILRPNGDLITFTSPTGLFSPFVMVRIMRHVAVHLHSRLCNHPPTEPIKNVLIQGAQSL
jgi:antibiotic biosynthesis monooxygenase (ABM) superfamily enzyme